MTDYQANINEQLANTVEADTRRSPRGSVLPIFWMARSNVFMPPWWSRDRDKFLRNFWKKSDHLAGAIYTMQAKMTAIDWRIEARNPSNRDDVVQAEALTELYRATAQFGSGWVDFWSKWLEDFLTQDNGAFMEIIGGGPKDGPIKGTPVGFAHLDSFRCQRTGNPEFPILYTDVNGKIFKLHFTRVAQAAQMPSSVAEMYGVGFCAVSRAANVAQTLVDILVYKQEKLGSRPHRAIIVTRGGLDPDDVRDAFSLAEEGMDNAGLSRYSKLVVVGSSTLTDADMNKIELSSLPEGFDERTSIELGMATIALAFGVDTRELFPATSAGATRADAMLQHLKQRGKGPGQILQIMESIFNYKLLPAHLRWTFDFQDDAQDKQVADIKKVRSDRYLQDATTGVLDTRTLREQMLQAGDITRFQFEYLELSDGRLANGESSLSLFYSNDRTLKKLLDLGLSDPLNMSAQDPQAVLIAAHEKLADIYDFEAQATTQADLLLAAKAVSALTALKDYYEPEKQAPQPQLPAPPGSQQGGADRRVRTNGPGVMSQTDVSGTNRMASQDGKLYDDQPA